MSSEIVVTSKEAEQASSKSNLDGWKFTEILPGFLRRNPKRLVGGIAILGIAGAGAYFVKEAMETEPQQEIAVGKTICPTDEARDGETSTSIDFDGQRFTFGTGMEGTEVLVRLTADTNGEIHDIEPIGDLKDRTVDSSEDEIIEIYDPKGQGSADDEVLMSIWYEDEPAELVVSVPCE